MNIFQKLGTIEARKLIFYSSVFFIQKYRFSFYFYFYFYFFSNLSPIIEKKSRFHQPAQFSGKGSVRLSAVTVGVWSSPHFFSSYSYFEAREESAEIIVGDGAFFNNDVSLIADGSKIEIGNQCLIGSRASITDSDFHGLESANRHNGQYKGLPVKIRNNFFIGNDAKILKGVTVGDGAVIGAGTIVVTDVSPMSIYTGVPAKFIRNI